ncbi:hypothetical protein DFH07DRAFT_854679, partial [Mycena maculata]
MKYAVVLPLPVQLLALLFLVFAIVAAAPAASAEGPVISYFALHHASKESGRSQWPIKRAPDEAEEVEPAAAESDSENEESKILVAQDWQAQDDFPVPQPSSAA